MTRRRLCSRLPWWCCRRLLETSMHRAWLVLFLAQVFFVLPLRFAPLLALGSCSWLLLWPLLTPLLLLCSLALCSGPLLFLLLLLWLVGSCSFLNMCYSPWLFLMLVVLLLLALVLLYALVPSVLDIRSSTFALALCDCPLSVVLVSYVCARSCCCFCLYACSN